MKAGFILAFLVIMFLVPAALLFAETKEPKQFVAIELEHQYPFIPKSRVSLFFAVVNTERLDGEVFQCERKIGNIYFRVFLRKLAADLIKFIYEKEDSDSYSRFDGVLMLALDNGNARSFLATGGNNSGNAIVHYKVRIQILNEKEFATYGPMIRRDSTGKKFTCH